MTRITSRTVLGLVLAFAAGCGGGGTPEGAKVPDPGPASVPGPNAGTQTPPPAVTPPPPSPAPTPVTGELDGQPFAPAVEYQDGVLTFRGLRPDGFPDNRVVEIRLTAAQVQKPDGLKVTVGKGQPDGPDVPDVMTWVPDRKPNPLTSRTSGYDLTLEFGRRDGRRLPGRVTLALPDGEKTRLTGSFVAEITRPPTEAPGPDDLPYVHGTLRVAGWADDVKAGYVRVGADGPLNDTLFLRFDKPGAWTLSKQYRPRESVLVAGDKDKPGRYEHTRLLPGRYLVFAQAYARPDGGPAVWSWVDVKPDTQVTLNLSLDAGRYGGLEVAAPAGAEGPVLLVPAAADGKPWDDVSAATAASMLDLQAEVKDKKAAFGRLAPGRYEARVAGYPPAVVEVKPGEVAKVEVKK
jgi:hypothetical protein